MKNDNVYIISNVEYPIERKLKVNPNDILVFLNKAASAQYYESNDVLKFAFHRSPKDNYGEVIKGCINKYVFGHPDKIPKQFLDSLKQSYDWNYDIEDGETKSPTTGYIVTKYLEKIYKDKNIILVNFGYEVKNSTPRCLWHNWKFEAKDLKKYKHIFTADYTKINESGYVVFYGASNEIAKYEERIIIDPFRAMIDKFRNIKGKSIIINKEIKDKMNFEEICKKYNINHIKQLFFDLDRFDLKILKSIISSEIVPDEIVIKNSVQTLEELKNDYYNENSNGEKIALKRKLKLFVKASPWTGDNVYLPTALKNVIATGKFKVNVESNRPEIWENCNFIDKSITMTNSDYCIRQHNSIPWTINSPHLIHGVTKNFEDNTGIKIPVLYTMPEIYCNIPKEKLKGLPEKYVVINNGWQNSAPAKKWSNSYWQKLIDMNPNIRFVQMGQSKNHAKLLNGAISMIDKTNFIDYVRLIRDCECVISPPSSCIHIAALFKKNFIMIGGGREPVGLTGYDYGIKLSTCGQLPCCRNKGCHKNKFEKEGNVCLDFSIVKDDDYPTGKCMQIITPEMVNEKLINMLIN